MIREELGLSGDRVRDILDTELFFRAKRSALKAKLKTLRSTMERICLSDNCDSVGIMQLANEIGKLKKTLYLEKTELRLAIRHLLTAEQLEKLRLYRMRQVNGHKQRKQSNFSDFPIRYVYSKEIRLPHLQERSCQ